MRTAKVLVASDKADDARQVQRLLKADFGQVQVTVDADRCVHRGQSGPT